MFSILNVKDKEYRCRLTTKNCVELERKIGTHPLNIFIAFSEGKYPRTEQLLSILFYSMKDQNHSIKFEDMFDLYDDYIEDGHTLPDLMEFLADVLEVSGFIPSEKN